MMAVHANSTARAPMLPVIAGLPSRLTLVAPG